MTVGQLRVATSIITHRSVLATDPNGASLLTWVSKSPYLIDEVGLALHYRPTTSHTIALESPLVP